MVDGAGKVVWRGNMECGWVRPRAGIAVWWEGGRGRWRERKCEEEWRQEGFEVWVNETKIYWIKLKYIIFTPLY